ncbi:excinuclease ABC subunit A [Paenibacillus montaniterrae]|uniref:UvrABC system protein A n=1 Tax=Paenibacillus montaniterrae TaxID=429341 RepID=A0A920CV68_9BACL|nr:excinuclease ABC subunit UvrA [Paenibacillus montaniterrae]GIP14691.1 excinuclease ABC subunit A [Paenibacillus montaniterrae]
MSSIKVRGAKEGNLKNISLDIPRDQLVVLTGLSGSGKSTLAVDVIFQECQRQYLEAIGLQGIQKPQIDSITNVSPAIMISQHQTNKNPRSTVGTLTNIYTDLRMVYEKLAVRACPSCHTLISAAACKEETEKVEGDFKVYMACSACGYKMDKLTRSHFSYNTMEGACSKCEGLGKVMTLNKPAIIQEQLSLEDGAVHYWDHGAYKDYQIAVLYSAFEHYGVPVAPGTPVAAYSEAQKELLYYGVDADEVKKRFPDIAPPKTVSGGKFEGIYTTLWRRLSEKGGEDNRLSVFFESAVCPDCNGERLAHLSRHATVADVRLPELTVKSLEQLLEWIVALEQSLSADSDELVQVYLLDIKTKVQRLLNVGLGYLSLDRATITLSGGELQRIKLAAALDSDLTGLIYILDEPTIGLHAKDTQGIIEELKRLRDKGNSVLVIEHDPDVMQQADYIIDIGPGSGKHGGQIIGEGTLQQLMEQEGSVTGAYLQRNDSPKSSNRKGSGEYLEIKHATAHNLQNVHVRFPLDSLIAVTGVSGSGKSTLVFDVLAEAAAQSSSRQQENVVLGKELFDQQITIEQAAISKMKRSNVATYSEVYTEIRKLFAGVGEAKEKGLTAKHFSFNTPGGRCENCQGLGFVTSNMLFFKDIEVKCPVCQGHQFNEEVLSVKYEDLSIRDVLQLSVEDALQVFCKHSKIQRILQLLHEVGLDYVQLGQTLTTLSGGEGQRLKLAKELISNKGKRSLYLMDEPTTGLHPVDVDNFIVLLNRIVDEGNTVIIVEHNQQVIAAADWIIDLGPEGGNQGGQIVFEGTPAEMMAGSQTSTAQYLRQSYSV